jgi:hypothetical protein
MTYPTETDNHVSGSKCSVTQKINSAVITCDDGTTAEITNGVSCLVVENLEGAKITCGDNSVQINHGDDAPVNPYNIVNIIDPCGEDPGNFNEVLLQFENGDVLAYFDDNVNKFLTLLTPGTYKTTDAQKCKFKINNDMSITIL